MQRASSKGRLQCYEGIDANQALYEWNHARQLLALRRAEHASEDSDVYGAEFLIDCLSDGSSVAALCRFMEQSRSLAAILPAEGRSGTTHHGNANHRRAPPHLAAGGPAAR
ncbi:MAG: hypothetical protein F9K43_00635, partial [Bauldia sp.]